MSDILQFSDPFKQYFSISAMWLVKLKKKYFFQTYIGGRYAFSEESKNQTKPDPKFQQLYFKVLKMKPGNALHLHLGIPYSNLYNLTGSNLRKTCHHERYASRELNHSIPTFGPSQFYSACALLATSLANYSTMKLDAHRIFNQKVGEFLPDLHVLTQQTMIPFLLLVIYHYNNALCKVSCPWA